jgi:amidase
MTARLRSPFGLLLCALVATTGGAFGQARPPSSLPAFDVVERSIEDVQRAMQAGQVTSRQLVDLYVARIEAYDEQGPALNAIAAVNPRAREAASALDAERASRGPRGPLHGIPILVKDNYETIEMPTTAGSIAFVGFQPGRDAFQVQRLKAAGAVILGKTNMHELAAGIFTVGSSFGQTRNPYDLDRNPGGSSGGTGAAVAAGFALAGMGSDTCGSIRNPASHNGLVGLRGTQGLASRTGIVPLSSSQDIGGPLARSITDLAILLDATVGADAADASTAVSAGHVPSSYRSGLKPDALKGARIGVVRSLFGTAADDQEVAGIVQKAVDGLKQGGAEVSDVVIPGLEELLRDSSMIGHDFKFDLAEYLAGARNPPVRSLGEILDRGLFHTALEGQLRLRNAVVARESDESRRARIKRTAIRQAVESVLEEHRLVALVYPTLRRKPARIGDGQAGSNCQLSAHSGLPALGLPAGLSADGLPIGMDLLGAAWSEQDLLSLGYSIERTLALRRPPFSTPALVDGKAPPARATNVNLTGLGGSVLTLVYDETASRLQYTLKPAGTSLDRAAAIWLHVGTSDKPGAARHLLFPTGGGLTGSIALTAADRRDLSEGRLLVRTYLRDRAGSAGDHPISFPR